MGSPNKYASYVNHIQSVFRRSHEGSVRPQLNPSFPCPTCKGTGVESWSGPNAGSCSECRGLGRINLSEKQVRKQYRRIRSLVCLDRAMGVEDFDQLVQLKLLKEPLPYHWLEGARSIAQMFGTKI